MRGIPPHGAGGYMRPRMAVPERQPSLHERLKEINYADFSNQTGIKAPDSAFPLNARIAPAGFRASCRRAAKAPGGRQNSG